MQTYLAYIILLGFIVLLFCTGIIISLLGGKVCLTINCKNKAELIKKSLNTTQNPCDDFYNFVCGNYGVSGGKYKISARDDLEKTQFWKIVSFLKAPIDERKDDRILKIMKVFYRRCIDLERIEQEDISTLLEVLLRSVGFPLINRENWVELEQIFSIAQIEEMAYEYGLSHGNLFDVFVAETKPGLPAVVLSIPSSLLNLKSFNASNYLRYMMDVFRIVNKNNTISKIDMKDIKQVRDLKKALFKAATDHRKQLCSIEEFDKNIVISAVDLLEIDDIGNFVQMTWVLTGIAISEFSMTKGTWDYLKELNKLTDKFSTGVFANYVAFEYIIKLTPFLPQKFREFYNKYLITQKEKESKVFNSRKLHCAGIIKDIMGTALSTLYMRKYFPNGIDNVDLNVLTKNVKNNLNKLVKTLKWMDQRNRYETSVKINTMAFVSPLPYDVTENLMDTEVFDVVYMFYCFPGESILKSYLGMTKSRDLRSNSVINPNITWTIFNNNYDIFSTEMVYDRERNLVIVPFGLLQYPVFDGKWPKYLNYGGLGSGTCHEIIHAIDFGSAKKYSNETKGEEKTEWHWSNFTLTNYLKERNCFLEQYNKYIFPLAQIKIKDSLCVEGNIADSTGARLSFFSYETYSNERFFSEASLPGLQHFSNDQLFYINYASMFCEKHERKYNKKMVESELAEPSGKYTVLGSLRNSMKFSEAFHCKVGDPMNPRKKCVMW